MLVQVLSVFLDSSFAMALHLKNVSVLDLRSRLAETAREAADRFPGVFDGRFYLGTDRLIANASDDFLEGRPFEDLRKILLVQFFLQSRMERALREGQKQVFLKLFSKGPQIGMALVYAASCGVQPESAMRALQSLLPGTQEVRNSFYLWHHPELSYVYCYREVCKIRGQEVGRKDLKAIERELREQLLLVPSLTPGLFWPYNKEDAYRQIQLLQREIKRNEDLPHVSVHFREQTASSLEFLIYLVRPKFAEPLDQVFKCLPDSLPFFCRFQYENRVPTPVQAGVFSVKLPSDAFEVCGSINLLYARRYLLKFLEAAVGPFRDYNGGLFEMQQQHFEAIRVRLADQIPHFDLFAEKVFYALHPVESWLSLSLNEAEDLFRTFSELLEEKKPFAVRTRSGRFTIVKTGNDADLIKLRRLSAEGGEIGSHAHLTFGDSHYLCLIGPQSEQIQSILKENAFPKEKTTRFHLLLQEGAPPSLNPHYSSGDMRCRVLNKLLFEGLTRLNGKGETELGAADKMAVSKEGLLYTFKLRPFCWSNGEKVTAADYTASWQSALNDPVIHPELLFGIKNARKLKEKKCSVRELGARALDAETLEIELEAPDPAFLAKLAQPYFFPLFGSFREPKWFNGPYLLREENKEGLLLERNPYFWDPKRSYFEQIQVAWISDIEDIYHRFQTGRADWVGDPLSILSKSQIKQLELGGKLIKWKAARRFLIHFNTKHPLLRSPWIRKAFNASIDRNLICQTIFPYSVPLQPGLPDKGAANRFFEKGLEELGLAREEFPPLTFSYSLQTRRQELALYLQSAWQETLGIEVKLEGHAWNQLRSKIEKRTFEICGAIAATLNEDSPLFFDKLEGKSSWNFSEWTHDGYRELVELAKKDKTKCQEHLEKAREILEQEAPIASLFNYTHLFAHSPELEGYAFDQEGCVDLSGVLRKS